MNEKGKGYVWSVVTSLLFLYFPSSAVNVQYNLRVQPNVALAAKKRGYVQNVGVRLAEIAAYIFLSSAVNVQYNLRVQPNVALAAKKRGYVQNVGVRLAKIANQRIHCRKWMTKAKK